MTKHSNFGFFDARAMMNGEINRGKDMKVFDWDKAARIINEKKKERAKLGLSINIKAEAGLQGDWEYTGGVIYENGKPITSEDIGYSYTYLASTWATPTLEIEGEDIECYIMQSKTDNWDAHTKWPDSALRILKK